MLIFRLGELLMNLRKLMELWQKRGITFGRSSLLRRGEALAGVMEESIAFLRGVHGIIGARFFWKVDHHPT